VNEDKFPQLSHTSGLSDAAIDAAWAICPPDADVSPAGLLPVVVGAHPRSEMRDRPLASRLLQAIRLWQRENLQDARSRLRPIILTDLWYLNDKELLLQPTICIGDPSSNAATAYYATRLPKAYVVDGQLQVLADMQFLEPTVVMWGIDANTTRTALDWFIARAMPSFLESAHE